MKAIGLPVLATLLAACFAAPLTPEAAHVRQLQPTATSPCKYLGVVEVSGYLFYSSLPEAQRDMLAKLRNETARRGGNAYALTALFVERGFNLPSAHGDAYSCP